jgi:hypothetical protein
VFYVGEVRQEQNAPHFILAVWDQRASAGHGGKGGNDDWIVWNA